MGIKISGRPNNSQMSKAAYILKNESETIASIAFTEIRDGFLSRIVKDAIIMNQIQMSLQQLQKK